MRAFALEYRFDGNATQAAIRAHYSVSGAKDRGFRLLRHPKVIEFLEDLGPGERETAGLSREFIIGGLIAMTQQKAVSERGKLEAFRQLAKFLAPHTPGREPVAGAPEELSSQKAKQELLPARLPDEGDQMRSLISSGAKR